MADTVIATNELSCHGKPKFGLNISPLINWYDDSQMFLKSDCLLCASYQTAARQLLNSHSATLPGDRAYCMCHDDFV